MTLKSLHLLAASAVVTFAGLPSLWAQVATSITVPIGFIKVTVAAAPDASTPTNAVVSVPFYRAAVSNGPIVSVDDAASVSITGANWTAGQFLAAPHLLRIRSGAHTGRFFLITAHTSNQLTVDTGGYTFVTGAPATTTELQLLPAEADIVPAHTLGTLFGTSTVAFKSGISASVADNVIIWDGSMWVVHYHDGTSWRKAGSFISANNAMVRPDFTMFIIRRATTALDLTLTGAVPSATERSDIRGPGSVFLSQRFPFDATLSSLALHSLPGWLPGDSASSADTVAQWNGSTWETFYYNGSHWRKAGSVMDADTQPVVAGAGLFITRRSSAVGSSATLAQPLPYSIQP